MGTPSGVLAQTVPMPRRAGPEVEALLWPPCPSSEQDSTPPEAPAGPGRSQALVGPRRSRGRVPLARAGLSRGGQVAPAAECKGWGGASALCAAHAPDPSPHGPEGSRSRCLGCGRDSGCRLQVQAPPSSC